MSEAECTIDFDMCDVCDQDMEYSIVCGITGRVCSQYWANMTEEERKEYIESKRSNKKVQTKIKRETVLNDDCKDRRKSSSITSVVRALKNKEILSLASKLLKENKGNINYKEKATEIIDSKVINIVRQQRIILEAYCRGCRDILKYIK